MRVLISALCISLLAACAAPRPTENSLLSSIKFGVLKDTRLNQWHRGMSDPAGTTLDIQYLDVINLHRQLTNGNIDVAVGIPVTDSILEQGYWSSEPLSVRTFTFYVRSDDPRKLHKYSFFNSFSKKLKRIGYVSTGESGIVNEAINTQSKMQEKLVACGAMAECYQALRNREIDSLFADEAMLKAYMAQNDLNTGVVASSFSHQQAFTLLVNQRTVSRDEFNKLNKMLR
ncbi:transporter substrate-binding domain-containing protein [Motilimonas pumila]|uniref:Uncharacterized protein n=1 Tax=Motilimonas pumila TaxID=2303987 RepID=A0A418YE09_9GAMM|nr:transporter substrate-binding domain-containing protein [Motilimonas pumila]RJG42772.1 hypothetical protein D1Z90_11830 [Motilimonas pumila]